MYRVTTNEGEHFVVASETTIRKRMWDYIRKKRAQGCSLNTIIFSYAPLRIEHWGDTRRKEQQ